MQSHCSPLLPVSNNYVLLTFGCLGEKETPGDKVDFSHEFLLEMKKFHLLIVITFLYFIITEKCGCLFISFC